MTSNKSLLQSGDIDYDTKYLEMNGYRLGPEIGCGAFAKVKKATWCNGNKQKDIAVKIIDLTKTNKEYQRKFMPREFEIWPRMKHDNIIRIYSQVTIGHRVYTFMELASNGDIIEHLHQHGSVPEVVANKWTGQLTRAVRHCHSQGVAHRDLKCENLLIDGRNNLKLADFGFARNCVDKKTHRRLLSNTFCGSAAYVAPEVLQSMSYNPFRADVWSIGVCLYTMLHNGMPFDDSNLTKLLDQQLTKAWSTNTNTHISRDALDFLHKTLEPDPMKRPTIYSLCESLWLNHTRN